MKASEFVYLPEVLDLMLDAVCVVDRAGDFVFVSAAFEGVFGYQPNEVIGKPMDLMVYQEDLEKTHAVIERLFDGELIPRFENRWIHKSGRIVYVLWSARWSDEHQIHIGVAHDITQRKQMEARLERMAQYDSLTDLPNRSLFLDRLQTGMTRARREKSMLALMFIDVDDFKNINDKYGHGVGDTLLKAIADRLQNSIRESDSVARQGGDEFLMLLNDINQVADALKVAEKIRAKVKQLYQVDGLQLKVSVSIGIAFFPEHSEDVLQMIQYADHAMYRSKNSGGDSITVFDL